MKDQTIITIGRQFGSGGRAIGQKLAQSLDISFYDKELIDIAARESGLCPEVFEKADERASSSLLYAFSLGYSHMGVYTPYNDFLSNERLFKLQSDAIRKLVENNRSCVLVGRCADYILREYPGCVSFFIHDKQENRIRMVMERQQLTEAQAKELINKTDKSRAGYYNYYTNKQWGKASSYDFTIDSSILGIDGTVQLIGEIIKLRKR